MNLKHFVGEKIWLEIFECDDWWEFWLAERTTVFLVSDEFIDASDAE